jgi:signal peptidase II
MDLYDSITIIDNFFHLTYISNDGMAFGINFHGGIYFFTAVSFILTIILIIYLWSERKSQLLLRISLALIIAGAIGNFIDRALYREVVDMFDFEFWGWHFYIFNVADSCVTIGMVLYLIYSLILQPKQQKIN